MTCLDESTVMRMRALDALEVPSGLELESRHPGDTHLVLVDLKIGWPSPRAPMHGE